MEYDGDGKTLGVIMVRVIQFSCVVVFDPSDRVLMRVRQHSVYFIKETLKFVSKIEFYFIVKP